MVDISTSILSQDRQNIMKTIYNLEVAGTNYFHIDVMDGKFVEGFTNKIMEEYCGYIKSISNIPLDIHLMVEDVKKYIDTYLNFEPNIITFHIEAVEDKNEALNLINYIKSNNCKVGLAVSPDTDVEEVYDLLPYVHVVLIMTVVPGKGGQSLIESTLEKINRLKKYIDTNCLDVFVEADGGIKIENGGAVKEAGADILVSGTGILGQKDFSYAIKELKK